MSDTFRNLETIDVEGLGRQDDFEARRLHRLLDVRWQGAVRKHGSLAEDLNAVCPDNLWVPRQSF